MMWTCTDLLIGKFLGLLESLRLRNPISACKLNVEITDDQPWSDDAGAEQEGDVDFVGERRQGRAAHRFVYPFVSCAQLDFHDHRQRQDERGSPHQQSDRLPVTFRALDRIEWFENSKVALSTHDCQGEDTSVHGQEVHTDQDPTPCVSKVPHLEEVSADYKGYGEEIEQICQR